MPGWNTDKTKGKSNGKATKESIGPSPKVREEFLKKLDELLRKLGIKK